MSIEVLSLSLYAYGTSLDFCYNWTTKLGSNVNSISAVCKKVIMLAMFWYVISNCCIQKAFIIGIRKVSVTSKSAISDGKFWAKREILSRVGE